MAGPQDVSRRSFLSAATTCAAAVAIGEISSADLTTPASALINGSQVAGKSLTIDGLTAEVFARHLGSSFVIRGDSTPTTRIRLKGVTSYSAKKSEKRPETLRSPFSVVWRGANSDNLPQGTYRVDHDQLGSFELFLVPVSAKNDPLIMEAVFG